MNNLSMTQALSIWSDLDDAYHGKNGFGGDTAEIYIYRLMPYEPYAQSEPGDVACAQAGLMGERARAMYDRANESLLAILSHFARQREARIEVEARELGEWVKSARFTYRVAVRVRTKEK